MSTFVKFTNTKLNVSGKQGKLVFDGQGYVTLVVGGLNVFNTAGQFYPLEGAKNLFESSSEFMRRIQRGSLNGELGHPRYEPGMSEEEWVNRVFDINEPNICAHFKDIWIEEKNPINLEGQQVIPIMASVTPAGAKAVALEKALNTDAINVCFSIRGVTEDYYERGKTVRILKNIITFDFVNEPGIPIAEKWNSPALENYPIIEEDEKMVSLVSIEKAIEKRVKLGLVAENNTDLIKGTLDLIKSPQNKNIPNYLNW